jgi:hypothetical protein
LDGKKIINLVDDLRKIKLSSILDCLDSGNLVKRLIPKEEVGDFFKS